VSDKTETRIQYGVRIPGSLDDHRDVIDQWPDSDGDLYLDGKYRSADTGMTSVEIDPASLLKSAIVDDPRAQIVQRTYEFGPANVWEAAEPDLPNTPGSVVLGTAPDGTRGYLFLTADTDSRPWVRATRPRDYYSDAEITKRVTLFDAGATRS
jgi:hypothetical protein